MDVMGDSGPRALRFRAGARGGALSPAAARRSRRLHGGAAARGSRIARRRRRARQGRGRERGQVALSRPSVTRSARRSTAFGFAQLLSMTRLEAEQASYVISSAIGRALAQLVLYTQTIPREGRLELRCRLWAARRRRVELAARPGQGPRDASHVAAEAPERIVGDPTRLRQVLINLAGNAVNFTQKGGVGVQRRAGR